MRHFSGFVQLWLAIFFFSFVLVGCGAAPAQEPTPEIVTIIETVPVEVTRQVEVTRFVEVTRQVVVTQLVEVVVTPTQPPMSETPAPTTTVVHPPSSPYPTMLSTFDIADNSQSKSSATVPFFIENKSDGALLLNLYGPDTLLTVSLGKDEIRKTYLQEADYTYDVWRNGQIVYFGAFTINNFDKHEFFLRENKAVLWIP